RLDLQQPEPFRGDRGLAGLEPVEDARFDSRTTPSTRIERRPQAHDLRVVHTAAPRDLTIAAMRSASRARERSGILRTFAASMPTWAAISVAFKSEPYRKLTISRSRGSSSANACSSAAR